MARGTPAPTPRAQGVVLLTLLIALALMGLALLAASENTATAGQRSREQELLFVGDQYRQAIERFYFAAPPGTPRLLPSSVEQLLLDDRYPQPVQHLRRAYPDPFTGEPLMWVRQGERLMGVHSAARAAPLMRANFKPPYGSFSAATELSQWVFVFRPPAPAPGPAIPRKPAQKGPG